MNTAPSHGVGTNPQALSAFITASESYSIVASQDIVDVRGLKLWAKGNPVSSALQQRLLDRKLKQPLEACLLAEDGVTVFTLHHDLKTFLEQDTPLTLALRPWASLLLAQVKQLPLHSVAQLLLTAGQASRPESFDHALQAMALSGALMLSHGCTAMELRLAMLAGLLHDLGEMYIDPRFGEADADRSLDFQSYQQLVVHPHVGQLLIAQLTDYPKALARAVAEHHERLDGSGYPHALRREAVSPLGCMLAVCEAALAALRLPQAEMARASVSLRVVPGEFDLTWVGRIADAARLEVPPHDRPDAAAVQSRLGRLDAALLATQGSAEALGLEAETPELKAALALALHLLGRLRTGWFASGLWSQEALAEQDLAEAASVEDELSFRLRAIERAAQLRAGELPAADAQRLALFCTGLRTAAGL